MADLEIKIDMEELLGQFKNITAKLVKDVTGSIEALAQSTHKHIKEEAQNKLHSFREEYLANLEPAEEIANNVFVITLKQPAAWIETGIDKPYDMKPGLLSTVRSGKQPVKTVENGKNKGKKYRIVPMNQAKTSTQMASGRDTLDSNGVSVGGGAEQNMVDLVKYHLKKRGINFKKLELDKNGSPRIGRLHSLDIDSSTPGKGNTPQLSGINIYQNVNKKTGKVERQITTFRTVIEGDDGKWIHPAVKAANFFKEAKTWAETEWETKVIPMILDKYNR